MTLDKFSIQPNDDFLLDTNILVHMIREDDIAKAVDGEYQLSQRPMKPLISMVTLGEMLALGRKFNWGDNKLEFLKQLIEELNVIDISNEQILDKYAEIDHYSEKITKPARPMGKNDIWIAATASVTGAWLLTADQDFDHLHPDILHRIYVDPDTGATSI